MVCKRVLLLVNEDPEKDVRKSNGREASHPVQGVPEFKLLTTT